MEKRSALIIQVFEKLGAPLMAAVAEVAARDPSAAQSDRNDAGKVAELLGKTVQLSIALANVMDIKDTGTTADTVRLALAALVSPLVADHYRQTVKVPNDADIKRMVTALEAILTFSDNFAPVAETIKRMAHIDPDLTVIADETQTTMQYLSVMSPIIHEIGRFSFGQPEQKLLQETSDKLMKKAESIVARIKSTAADAASIKQAELQALKALSEMYVTCHKAETDRLMAMSEDERAQAASTGGNGVDKVWESFDKRAGMLEILCGSVAPSASGGAAAPVAPNVPSAPAQPQAQTSAPVETPSAAPAAPPPVQETSPPPAPEAAAPSTSEAAPPPAAPVTPEPAAVPAQSAQEGASAEQSDGGYNPMGFFKPGSQSEEQPAQPPVQPQAQPSAPVETPPEVNPEPVQETPPPSPPPPPTQPPAEPVAPPPAAPAEPAATETVASEEEGAYNPMGFFKPGAKSDDANDDGSQSV